MPPISITVSRVLKDELNDPDELPPAKMQKVIRTHGLCELLLPPGWAGRTTDWHPFNRDNFGMVRFGYSLKNPDTHFASSNPLSNGSLAFEHML